ncbi:MAG TPA: three-Cys-motif partner protein TcmP [Gemmataceae bacterium]|nr:three-Cys-motif partner protein TcmP [Gemmataceae bacterium]
MADTLPTTWPADAHTLAKHAILRRYLEAWFPILSRQASLLARQSGKAADREILFIDGFAGPGEYANGKEGSPVIALKAALDHSTSFPVPVRMIFVEKREDRYGHLQAILAPHIARAAQSRNVRAVEPRHGDCDTELNAVLDEFGKKNICFGPALAFLDQFDYGAVSMQLIARILKFGQCEVFSYLDYKDMNRWISDPNKAPAFTRAFGGEDWQGAKPLPERERRQFLLEAYKSALKDPARGGASYVVSFSMFDKDSQPLYWLIFSTNNLRGLEEMKRAMWSVDDTGEFRFSDEDGPDQLFLFRDRYGETWLAQELAAKLAGKTMTAAAVKEYVLVETPCYLFKGALKALELGNPPRITVLKQPAGRKRGTYDDDQLQEIEIRFERSLFDFFA